jgi:uncharacterized membrane protein YiaA
MLAAALALAGCKTIGNGGAPEPAFDIDADLKALSSQFSSSTSVSSYYAQAAAGGTAAVTARNRFITGRLVQIDLQYIQFIRSLTSDKQRLDTAGDLLNLTLNVAGTLTGGERAKANLAAAATALNGTKTTVDKQYFYEKSMDALVGTMNAKRKTVLVGILTGLATKTVEEYPFELALTQLNEYYMAGTLNGAIQFINVQSAEQEKASDIDIKNIPRLTGTTEANKNGIKQLTLSLNNATLATARQALAALGEDTSKYGSDLGQMLEALQTKIGALSLIQKPDEKQAAIGHMTGIFKAAGLLK